MKQIAYLCSQVTIPGSPIRRSDAFEHDRMMDAMRPEFAKRDLELTEVCWDESDVNWSRFDLALIGTCWDYWDRKQLFLDTLHQIESRIQLFNSARMVEWNTNKQYLKQLQKRGATLIPTQWIETPTADAIEEAFESLGCDDIVVKRQVGAGAEGQFRIKQGEEIPEMTFPMMAQPFFESIQSEGEISLIYIDGAFCHGLTKHAAKGDYRIQSTYGGTEEPYAPTDSDLETAATIINSLDETPLYARVDLIRGDGQQLYLMELELIEPYLYPVEGPDLGLLLADAVQRKLA